ncbi:MAG: alpha-1,2-fucosyltransferase, partial [Candidatus Absconditabacterales bacterium]
AAIVREMEQTNSIGLHVRRGDYVGSALGGICDKTYYENAIEFIKSKVQNPTFFIFSNDIQRCKDNLKTGDKSHFIDGNKGENAYKDMVLMSHCKHNIIANSSFSWWGARLNNNPEKIVIAPMRRHQTMEYANTVPSERIRL